MIFVARRQLLTCACLSPPLSQHAKARRTSRVIGTSSTLVPHPPRPSEAIPASPHHPGDSAYNFDFSTAASRTGPASSSATTTALGHTPSADALSPGPKLSDRRDPKQVTVIAIHFIQLCTLFYYSFFTTFFLNSFCISFYSFTLTFTLSLMRNTYA